jgi:hypothetical protein
MLQEDSGNEGRALSLFKDRPSRHWTHPRRQALQHGTITESCHLDERLLMQSANLSPIF